MKCKPPIKFNVQKLSERLRKTSSTLKLLFARLTAIFYLGINFLLPFIGPLFGFFVFLWMFVFPVLVVQCTLPKNIFIVAVAGSGYLLLCILDIILLYYLVADLYPLRQPKALRKRGLAQVKTRSKTKTLVSFFLTFCLSPYCFAIVYIFISTTNPYAFSVGKLGLLPAIFLSFKVWIPGVNNNIDVISIIAQSVKIFETIFGVFYTIFIVTVIGSFLRE